jgi:hypothetical protein
MIKSRIRLGKLWKVIVIIMGIIFINLKGGEYACKDCGEEVTLLD